MRIEKASVNDSEILTALTKKSKAHWGYTDDQINGWSKLLTITKTRIEIHFVYKLVIDNTVAGYYSYFNTDANTIQLDNLFVLPEYINKGLGTLLMDDFLLRVKNTSAKKVTLEADPNAENFYSRFGFIKTGRIKTSVKDRFLPMMELCLNTKTP